jgi:hypothetical protein
VGYLLKTVPQATLARSLQCRVPGGPALRRLSTIVRPNPARTGNSGKAPCLLLAPSGANPTDTLCLPGRSLSRDA